MTGPKPNEDSDRLLIREAVAEDVEPIMRIERQTFSRPWSARSFRDLLELPSAFILVAVPAPFTVQGYAVAYVAADVGELANLAVAREARGQGLGRALLQAVLHRAEVRGASAVYLDVRASNVSALSLYASSDFAPVGRRKDYYAHPAEDAIVMRRSIR